MCHGDGGSVLPSCLLSRGLQFVCWFIRLFHMLLIVSCFTDTVVPVSPRGCLSQLSALIDHVVLIICPHICTVISSPKYNQREVGCLSHCLFSL